MCVCQTSYLSTCPPFSSVSSCRSTFKIAIKKESERFLESCYCISKKVYYFECGVFYSLTSWNFVNRQLGTDEGIHLSHICLVEAKLSEEILSHGAPFVFCSDL